MWLARRCRHTAKVTPGTGCDDGGVRALFTFTGGSGHFLPTVPFSQVLRERGHEIMYAGQEGMVPAVVSAGWAAVASGGNTLLDPQARRPLATLDRVAEESAIRRSFARKIARERTDRLLEIAAKWRPDLIVRYEIDFAGAIAADVLGLPHAAVVVIAAGGFLRADIVEEPLAALRSEHGLDPAGAMGMPHRYLTIVPGPPSFRDPVDPFPQTAHYVRPAVVDQSEDPGLASSGSTRPRPGRPKVYVTLGTIFNQESGDLFERVLAGLAALPVEVVATVGDQIDPTELGPLPSNLRVESFVPLVQMLRDTDVVVSHGGSGTVIAALAFGIPQVILPLGVSQPLNADRRVALGVGIALDALHSIPTAIREATETVLAAETYRARADQFRAEIASLPDARHPGTLLENLAETRTPALPA